MGDLDKLLLEIEKVQKSKSAFNNDKKEFKLSKKEVEEVNNKLESFISKKKINLVRKIIVNRLYLILALFALILVVIPLSFLIYYYFNPYSKNSTQSINSFNSNQNNNLDNNFNKNNGNQKFQGQLLNESNNENNKTIELTEPKPIKYGVVGREELKKYCPNLNYSCVANVSLKLKSPGLCVFSNNKDECLKIYYSYFNNLEKKKKEFYKRLVDEFLNGTITKEEIEKKYNLTLDVLLYETEDMRLCKYVNASICG